MDGTFSEDDYGNIRFKFTDGSYAVVYWESFGEGEGGEFVEVETDTAHSDETLISLAYANTGRRPGPIKTP